MYDIIMSGKKVGFNGSFYTTETISAETNLCIRNEPILSLLQEGDNTITNFETSLVKILDLNATSSITSPEYYGNMNRITLTTTTNIPCNELYTYTLYLDSTQPANGCAVYIIHPRSLFVSTISKNINNLNVTTTKTNITLTSTLSTGTMSINYNLVINNKQ
jgi:hypothetical protein